MKRALVSALMVGLFLSVVAYGQPSGNIAKLFLVKPKAGMATQFEEAYKEHIGWHRSQNDSWQWSAWQYDSGERFGQYLIRTGNHSWSDFDARGDMDAADGADAQKRFGALVESTIVTYSVVRTDLSRADVPATPPVLITVTNFQVKGDKTAEFASVIKGFNAALDKANWPRTALWTQGVAGNQGNTFSVVILHQKWADKGADGSLIEAVDGAIGEAATAALMAAFSDCVESSQTDILRYRPDLSYNPGQ